MTRERLQHAQVGSDPFGPESQDRGLEQSLPHGKIFLVRMLMPDRSDLSAAERSREQAD